MRYQRLLHTCLITAMLAIARPLTSVPAAWSEAPRLATLTAQATARRPQLVRSMIAHDGWIYNFAFGTDGNTVVTSGSDRTARQFYWRDNVQNFRIDSEVSETWFSWVAMSPDGRTLVTSRTDGTIQLREAGTGEVKATLPERSNSVGLVAIAADNQTLVDATGLRGDFRIRLWNLETQQKRDIGSGWADLTAITPDGYILVSASSTGTATVWNLLTGRQLSTFPSGATAGATAIAITPDGLSTIVAKNGSVEQWDSRTGRLVRPLLRTSATIKALAVSPNGQTLAIGFGNYIQLRDLRTNTPLYNLPSNATGPQALSFSPDGRHLFNSDGTGDRFRVWQLP